jgi:Cu(I)/Ag(I) efflux system membrane protein CusA/SilA
MSLGGIAIAIGAMVDAAIVMIENALKHLERLPPGGRVAGHPRRSRSGRPFFGLLIITVSFLPIFALEDRRGLFKP